MPGDADTQFQDTYLNLLKYKPRQSLAKQNNRYEASPFSRRR